MAKREVQGGNPTVTGDDSVTVSMAVPLPPLPAAPAFHPDATNWSEPSAPPVEGMAGPEIDEPTEGVATFAPGQDNVEAAMHDLAEGMDLTVSTRVSDDDGPADKQILIRATEHDRERWKRAAQVAEVSLSALIRDTMNLKVTDILDCSHPMEYRQSYPWAEFCTKCDVRLSG